MPPAPLPSDPARRQPDGPTAPSPERPALRAVGPVSPASAVASRDGEAPRDSEDRSRTTPPALEPGPDSARRPVRPEERRSEAEATPIVLSEPPAQQPAAGVVEPQSPARPSTVPVSLDRAPVPANESAPPADEKAPPKPRPKPLLASEALMEDLAPVEPAKKDAQRWCAGLGSAFLILGTLPLLGPLSGGLRAATPWLVTGVITLVAAATRVTYRQRAFAMVVLGLLSGVVGLQASGSTLALPAGGTGWGLSRMVAAFSLAAALFFRARYRAYAGARVFLGTALALTLPFVVHAALDFGSTTLAQVGSVVALLGIVSTLSGFMGAETTVAGAYLGPAIVVAFATELGLRAAGAPDRSILAIVTSSLAFAGGAMLAAIGVFQIAAFRFAADARRIDLHSPVEPPPPPRERDRGEDWSTRE